MLALVLFATNAWICRELFRIEYLRYLDSIEGAYIGLARWILEHPFDWSWFPLWYNGIPFQDSYPPLLHFLVALTAGLSGASPALSYHAVTAVLYCLGPVTLFWFACRLSGERWVSFYAALFYSVVSPAALLVSEIAADMGTAFGARRLHALVRYGEGPHIAAMTLLPVALVALDWALSKRRPVPVYTAVITLAAVVLTNWLGAFALAAAVLAYLLARWDDTWFRTALWAAGIGVLAYAMASPWIPPSTIATIRRNAQFTVGSYPLGIVQFACISGLALMILGVWILMRRAGAGRLLQFSVLFFLPMGSLVLVWYWFGIYVMPQPSRYHLEMEMAIALLFAAAARPIGRLIPRGARTGLVVVCFFLLLYPFERSAGFAHQLIRPVEIGSTVQYQVAHWLNFHRPGRRVFVTGTTRFWLNAFADNPQFGGGFDQGIRNPEIPPVNYGITFNEKNDAERAAMWLRAYAVDAVAVSGAGGRDPIKDFKHPDKFAGLLPELWRDGEDVIYEVPRRSSSLARVVRATDIVSGPLDHPYLDTRALEHFDHALADVNLPTADFGWVRPGEAVISAYLNSNQLLSIAVSYDPGWHATVNGKECPLQKDALGLIVLKPACDGPCRVRLVYDGGLEMTLARSASTIAFLVPLLLWMRRRRS